MNTTTTQVTKPRSFTIMPHELETLILVGRVGIVTTPMILDRIYRPATNGAKKYAERRLRQLAAHGYLELNRVTLNTAQGPRRLSNFFRLTPEGADIVREMAHIESARIARSDPPQPMTLQHRLGVVRVRLAFDDACASLGLPAPHWIMEQDMFPNTKIGDPAHQRFILYEVFPGNDQSRITCRPDASVLLQLPGQPSYKLALYLEYDRSTESEKRLRKSKPAGYAALLGSGNQHYRRHWPEADFARVLFVVRSRQRRQNLMEWFRDLPGAENYRFVVEKDLQPERLLTGDNIWTDVTGRFRRILHPDHLPHRQQESSP